MAGAGYKLFTTGSVLTAAEVNTYLQEQTVMVFADATARTTALSGVVAEGMLSYLKDTDVIQYYNGSSWTTVNTDQTPLTTKGDLFTYSTADARLAVGNNGETLVADSSATTGLRWQGNFAAGKNKIINGDFNIWQRGTSFTNLATNAFAADRWRVSSANTTIDVSRSTFTLGAAPLAGLDGKYFATVTADSTDTDARLNQPIEGVATFAGQTVTVSFYAKSTVTTDALRWVRLQQSFGTGGSPSSVVNTDSAAITLTGSWARYSVTLSVPSISGKTLGTDGNDFLGLAFGLKASTAQTLDIWGVQLEAGNTATAFQTATGTLAGELAACQRYYELNAGTVFSSATNGGFANSYSGAIQYKVTKRATPTLTIFSGASQTGTSGSATWYASATGTVATATAESNETSHFSIRQTGASGYSLITLSYTSSAEL